MLEKLYDALYSFVDNSKEFVVQYFRRFIRLLTLPYCYIYLVNWSECNSSRWQVAKDFYFIFFKLKYYPDNYSLCRFWEKDRDEWLYYYGSIYDPYQRLMLRKKVQPKEYDILFDNKEICYQLCNNSDLPLPKQFGVVDRSEVFDFVNSIFNIKCFVGTLIIKPLKGISGKSIFLAKNTDDKISFISDHGKLKVEDFNLLDFGGYNTFLIQEYVSQHDDVARIAKSVNTVRIITMLTENGEVLVLGAYMRFGLGDSYIDNVCQGGLMVGVDLECGTLNDIAYDFEYQKHYVHPTSHFKFHNFQIPYWEEIVTLATKTQHVFSYSKLMGMDIGILQEGPVLFEINSNYDNVAFEHACGPLFKNKSIYREFKNYNLLINKYQKNLYSTSL